MQRRPILSTGRRTSCFGARYQRGSRRWRGPPPPPPPLGRPPPPPPPKPRPPPPPPWGFGRASLILSARPSRSVPLRAAMARSASAESVISTNANPRERPGSRSVTRLTRSTCPYGSKSERMEDSVAAKSKLPTKMFFISSSCLSIVRLASADLDLGQGGAGLSKGSFSIAGHYQRTPGLTCLSQGAPFAPRGQAGQSQGLPGVAAFLLLHRDVPNLLTARLTFRPFHSQGDRVVAALGELVDWVLLRRNAPVATIPLPGRHLARRLIAEGHHPPVQIDRLEVPVGLELA